MFFGSSQNAPGAGEVGLYGLVGGQLTAFVAPGTDLPGAPGTQWFFGPKSFSFDGENAALMVQENSTGGGVYVIAGDSVSLITDANTAVPSGVGSFGRFDTDLDIPTIDSGTVAFLGGGLDGPETNRGVYVHLEGALHKVIAVGDELDGKTVSSLTFGTEALSGAKLAFGAGFPDGSHGLFVAFLPAQVPALGWWYLALLAATLVVVGLV